MTPLSTLTVCEISWADSTPERRYSWAIHCEHKTHFSSSNRFKTKLLFQPFPQRCLQERHLLQRVRLRHVGQVPHVLGVAAALAARGVPGQRGSRGCGHGAVHEDH